MRLAARCMNDPEVSGVYRHPQPRSADATASRAGLAASGAVPLDMSVNVRTRRSLSTTIPASELTPEREPVFARTHPAAGEGG